MVSGVGRGMGVVDRVEIVEGEGAVFGSKCGASHCNQWDSLREGRRRTLPKGVWGGPIFLFPVPCNRLSWLVIYRAHVKIDRRMAEYRRTERPSWTAVGSRRRRNSRFSVYRGCPGGQCDDACGLCRGRNQPYTRRAGGAAVAFT